MGRDERRREVEATGREGEPPRPWLGKRERASEQTGPPPTSPLSGSRGRSWASFLVTTPARPKGHVLPLMVSAGEPEARIDGSDG